MKHSSANVGRLPDGDLVGIESEHELRKAFAKLHSELRNLGLNPIEALSVVAKAVAGEPDNAYVDLESLKFLTSLNADSIASAFQTFLSDDLRNAFGQYLTPKPVADHVAQLVAKSIKEGGKVVDPFGGSGILLQALYELRPDLRFSAIEINPSAADVAKAISKSTGMGMSVHVGDAFELWLKGGIEKFDALVMNPPFGSKLVTLTTEQLSCIPDFNSWATNSKPPVELLSLELAVSIVKKGGLVAAVLPQSVLSNRSFMNFRKGIFSRHKLVHVTSLPEATFSPFRGVAKACVCLIKVEEVDALPYTFSVRKSRFVGYDETGRPFKQNDLVKPNLVKSGSIDESAHISLVEERRSGRKFVRLGDHAEVFRGRNPKDTDYIEGSEGPFLLKVGSLSGAMLNWRRRKRSYVTNEWYQRAGDRALKVGDVCLTAAAHKPRYVGLKIDLVDALPEYGAVPSAELLVIRSKDVTVLPPEVILFFLRSGEGYSRIQEMVRGSTAHLYPSDLENIEILLPFTKDQVATIRESFAAAAKAHRRSLELQAKAFEAAGLEPFFSPIADEDT